MFTISGILEQNCLRLGVNLSALVSHVRKHLGGQLRKGIGAQTGKVLGTEFMHVEHVCIVQKMHEQMN